MSALLTEVRGLRQALEEMGTAGPRVQLALGRLQLQEQRVNTAIRRLESIRAFDLFPQTAHVETVSVLVRGAAA